MSSRTNQIKSTLFRNRGSAAKKKINDGLRSVKKEGDLLTFLLAHGAELELDLSQVFLDCAVIRHNQKCKGCPLWQKKYNGCVWFDHYEEMLGNWVPEDVKKHIDNADDADLDKLVEDFLAKRKE